MAESRLPVVAVLSESRGRTAAWATRARLRRQEHGVVVGRSGEALLVAVPAQEAAQVAAASAGGELGLVLGG